MLIPLLSFCQRKLDATVGADPRSLEKKGASSKVKPAAKNYPCEEERKSSSQSVEADLLPPYPASGQFSCPHWRNIPLSAPGPHLPPFTLGSTGKAAVACLFERQESIKRRDSDCIRIMIRVIYLCSFSIENRSGYKYQKDERKHFLSSQLFFTKMSENANKFVAR